MVPITVTARYLMTQFLLVRDKRLINSIDDMFVVCVSRIRTDRWFSGKLWYLQHNCVGDTIVYH